MKTIPKAKLEEWRAILKDNPPPNDSDRIEDAVRRIQRVAWLQHEMLSVLVDALNA